MITRIFSPVCAAPRPVQRSALSALAQILDALRVRWVLIGALAANRYRTSPRLTHDVDLLLADAGPSEGALAAALQAGGWTVRSATAEGDLVRVRHIEFGAADLLIAGTDYQQQAIARAHAETLAGQALRVLTVEDVIIHKLIAGRHQDIADIEAIVAGHLPLDETYLARWVGFWDVAATWQTLRPD